MANTRYGRRLTAWVAGGVALMSLGGAATAEEDGKWTFGGALRTRYVNQYEPYASPHARRYDFEALIMKVGYDSSTVFGSAVYRFTTCCAKGKMRIGDLGFFTEAYAGYKISPQSQVIGGMNLIPFGLMPFASSSWYETMANQAGLEDVRNLGIKFVHTEGPFNLQAGYYVGSMPNGHNIDANGKGDVDRYSPNVVNTGVRDGTQSNNREKDMIAARVSYKISHGESSSSEIGASALRSTIHNLDTSRDGSRNAAAIHYDGKFGQWRTRFQFANQNFNVHNPATYVYKNDAINLGFFGYAYPVAAKGNIYSFDLNYSVAEKFGDISDVQPFATYSRFDKSIGGFRDSIQLLYGVSFTYRLLDIPLAVHMEMRNGKDMEDLDVGVGRKKRQFMTNIAYYF